MPPTRTFNFGTSPSTPGTRGPVPYPKPTIDLTTPPPPGSTPIATDDEIPKESSANRRTKSATTFPPADSAAVLVEDEPPIQRRVPKHGIEKVIDDIVKIYQKPGDKGREQVWELLWTLCQLDPSLPREDIFKSVIARSENEIEVENRDPLSFKDVVSRITEDLKEMFEKTDVDVLAQKIFAEESRAPKLEPRTLENVGQRWLQRWFEGNKSDDCKKLVGFIGEYVVFSIFQKLIPGFTEEAWTSGNRAHAFPHLAKPSDKTNRADFTFHDHTGLLAGLLLPNPTDNPKIFFIEVKASAGVYGEFTLTQKQAEFMRDATHDSAVEKVYVVLKVEEAMDLRYVRITQVIHDPYKKMREGKINFRGRVTLSGPR